MRSWLAILVTLIACDDHGAETLTMIKNKVCACKTASCAEQEIKQVPEQPIDSNHRTQTIARDMLDCLAKLQAADRPVTDPDAEAPTPDPAAQGSAATAPGSAAPGSATPGAPAAPGAPAPAASAAPGAPAPGAPTPAAPTPAAPTPAAPAAPKRP